MQELIRIESAPAKLGANFEEVKARLQAELAKYDVLVTDETLPDAKKLATELNQTAKAIDDRRKSEVAAVSEPIRAFDDQMKELVSMCKDGRQKLLDQIKIFEDETREKARSLLDARRAELWEQHGVEAGFRRASFDDMVMISAVTKAGNLASKQGNELESRVLADKALQDRTRMRLLELENASYKAGLSAPLTRDHVAGFLMADDAIYTAELERIIATEIGREEEAQRRMREKLERELVERQRREQEEREAEELPQSLEQADAEVVQHSDMVPTNDLAPQEPAEIALEPEQATSDAPRTPTKRVTVWACFTPEVPVGATDEQIRAALRGAMEKAGITTLQEINIAHADQMEAAE